MAFPCHICEDLLESTSSLRVHLESHFTEKRFQCMFCEKYFSQEINMKTHITLSHSTDKPFPCPKCDKHFARACDVKSHKKIHEDVQLRKNSIPCKICGMNFSRNSRLVSHQKNHTRHVTFECSTCAKKFLEKTYFLYLYSCDLSHT